jgi:tetratricopeptide (TPR) repeat protein
MTPVPGADEAPPSSGQLADMSPVRLYGMLAAGGHTGLLTLTLADCTTLIHFRKGNPEHVDSTHPEDALGTSLTQARLVTEDQLRQAEAAKERFAGELLAALFGLGLLQPATAFAQLGQRAHNILLRGLRAETGSFTYEPKELPSAKAMPLGNKWAVLLDQIRRIPTTELRRRLQPVLDLPVMKSGGRVSTTDLRFTPHEVRSLGTIDGVRSLGQLLTDFAQDADHLLRLVFLLKELDAVSFAAAPQRAAPPPPVQPKPAAPPPAAAPQAATPPRPATPPSAPAQPAAPAQAAAPRPTAPPAPAQPAAPAAAAPRPTTPPSAPAQPAAPAQAAAPRPAAPATSAPAQPAAPAQAAAPRPVAPAASAPAQPAAPAAAAPRPAAPPPAAAPAAARPAAPPTAAPAAPAAPAQAAPAAPAPKPAASTPAASAAPVDDVATLREVAAKMKDQNHFERLGLAHDATGAAVKISYFKLAKQYHPDTLPPGASPELAKLKADVFAFIGDAYRALSDDKSRANYLEELKSGGGGQVDVEAILKAEELFRKASVLVKGKKFAEAVKLLDEAIQLNADEAEFYALRGYSRFFTHADKKAGYTEALRDFQTSTKKNDKVAVAYYYHGVVAKLCGDNSGALKHFQRTVELQPNHIEAQRELRLAQQRK